MPAYQLVEIHPLFRDAFNRGDVEALAALYEPDTSLIVAGELVAGRGAIAAAFDVMVARQGWMTLETVSIVESPPGQAVLRGRWTVDYGDETTSGLSIEAVRRQPDRTWLIVLDNPYGEVVN
jgi:uncharacterized protein (TIGR02246 family)